MMRKIVAPSRLHFGLVNEGSIHPRFGGLGMMIENPRVVLSIEPSAEWQGRGPQSERALAVARRLTDQPHRVVVEECPPEHVGLGVGTALTLAVGKALRPQSTAAELASMTGRGKRSGVGLYGFELGGFVVDGGKAEHDHLPRLIDRLRFPSDWRIVLARPRVPPRWHGEAEQAAFMNAPQDRALNLHHELSAERDRIAELVREGRDFAAFADAIHTYNRRAGVWFEAIQGGAYASKEVAALVDRIRGLGFAGVGQSSWGPTVFTFTSDLEAAEWLMRRLNDDDPQWNVAMSGVSDAGARVMFPSGGREPPVE